MFAPDVGVYFGVFVLDLRVYFGVFAPDLRVYFGVRKMLPFKIKSYICSPQPRECVVGESRYKI